MGLIRRIGILFPIRTGCVHKTDNRHRSDGKSTGDLSSLFVMFRPPYTHGSASILTNEPDTAFIVAKIELHLTAIERSVGDFILNRLTKRA